MSRGPLRRLTGAAGLAGLAPTAAMLAMGSVSPVDAAIRGAATFGTVFVIGRVADVWLHHMIRSLERDPERPIPEGEGPRRDASIASEVSQGA